MTSTDLAKLVGALISGLLGLFPFLSTWFDKQPPRVQSTHCRWSSHPRRLGNLWFELR